MKPGREDRKFCDDTCRTSYNNRKRRESRKPTVAEPQPIVEEMNSPDYIQKIQEILLKNRSILEEATKDGTKRMEKRDLDGRGFIFKYFTSVAPAQNGNTYYFCFEYGYRFIENDHYVILVQRPREIIC